MLDYFDLAVHVFDPELRAHYDLERLWGDAPTETVTDEQPEAKLLAGDAPSSLTPPPSRAAEAAPVADDEAAPDDEAE